MQAKTSTTGMSRHIKSEIVVQTLRRHFGLHAGVVRAEIKAPRIFSLEEPISRSIPSSLHDITETEEVLRQVAEAGKSFSKAVQQIPDGVFSFQGVDMIGKATEALKKGLDLHPTNLLKHLSPVLNLKKITGRARAAGHALGERGWIVGPLMTHRGLSRALQEDTDSHMKDRYPVERLIRMVQESDGSRWQKTIREAVGSYRDERYRVVILSLLPVIESLVRERTQHRVDTNEIGRIGVLNRKANEETEDLAKEESFLLAAYEASIAGFIEVRWGDTPDMLEGTPSDLANIDRHWAMHGADDPERWEPTDAHRLLQVAAVLVREETRRSTTEG
jgi:hypothetical protein